MDQVLERNTIGMDAIDQLRSQVEGNIYLPGDEGFDTAKASWNLTIQHQPAVVVVAANEADVEAAVLFANQHDLPIAVQATGHGQFKTCAGGLLLVVSQLADVEIDEQNQVAHIGGGTRWGKVIEQAVAKNLVPISGSSATVGVVGYTLGGGFGLLSRKYGLAVDTVTSFRIVTPAGKAIAASPAENADLYWAVLGGGGSYGVITQISMRLYPHGSLFGGSVMYDASLSSQVYSAYAKWTKTLPDEVSSAIVMMTFPPVPFIPEFLHGRSMLIIVGTALADVAEAEALWAPMRNMPGAEFDSFRPMSYAESSTVFNDPVDPLPAYGRGVLLKDLDDNAIAKLLAAIGPAGQSPNLMFQMRHLEGASARPGKHANSVGDRRNAKYIIYFLGVPMGPATPDQMETHAEQTFAAIEPYIYSRGPLNWVGEGNVSPEKVKDVYHEDEYSRLTEIKKSVDPQNRFRYAGVGIE